jgi:hypothetical protein
MGMTQIPPPPPESPPPPPQVPIGYGYGFDGGKPRTNGLAIASLVLGILGCIPFLSGLLAILFGIMGIRKTRDSLIGGKGLAIAGLILGIISVVGWTGAGAMLGYGYSESKPAGIVAKQFLQNVSAGNINGAMANSSGFTPAQLQTQSGQMAAYGALQSVSLSSFNMSAVNWQTTMSLGGTTTFANGVKSCTFNLVKVNGTYKVTAYWVQ